MRIISGLYKGRKILPPKNLPVRPTTDFAREGLFNHLNNHLYFDEISVLDLCAGTGCVSYEFASRGVKNITAVDAEKSCVQFIRKTAQSLDLPIDVYTSDLLHFLSKTQQQWDVIFADPPFQIGGDVHTKTATLVFEKGLLKEDGWLVIEHGKQTQLQHLPHFAYHKTYGNVVFSFFKKE